MKNSEHQNTEELEKREIEKIKTDNLRSHPFNTKVYGENLQLPEHFLESIENNGVEEPLVINSENIVISGHRRLEAAKEVDLQEVPVRKKSYDSEEEEKEALIRHNKQREKTFSQRMEEALFYKDKTQREAKERMAGNQNFGEQEKGSTNDQLAEIANLGSRETYRKAEKVYNKSKEGDEEAGQLVKEIDNNQTSIHAAYETLFIEQETEEIEDTHNLTKQDFRPETIENYFPPNEPDNQTKGSSKTLKETATAMIESGEIFTHMYFSGPPGTGKTTLAKILIEEIIENPMNKYDLKCGRFKPSELRSKMEQFIRTSPVGNDSHTVILLDEFDKLEKKAQRKIRRLIEDNESKCRIIVTANDTGKNKSIDAIRGSRLRLREFEPFTEEDVLEYLKQVRNRRNLDLEDQKLEEIIKRADIQKEGRNLRAALDELIIELKMS